MSHDQSFWPNATVKEPNLDVESLEIGASFLGTLSKNLFFAPDKVQTRNEDFCKKVFFF